MRHWGSRLSFFPALDIRVKNVAGTYSLEHKGESDLFSQLFALLQLDKHLRQHTSKEEEHVAPLNFSLSIFYNLIDQSFRLPGSDVAP